ncbi:hypothetical protein MNBD_GAMMA10-1164 [hydrothermal vent metagenome]|uniref:DUF1499 domain-containing protein n=1 Tax=hydrothermal vent metagenome TaxID=652676 RepID=A0A3B0XAL7_9ZZZZ
MKLTLIILSSLIIIALAYFIYLGFKSHNGSPYGLRNSKLSPCTSKPNCICTEYPEDKSHFTEAFNYSETNTDSIVQSIRASIKQTGGEIINAEKINNKSTYISANYTSALFRYVDDFEVRIDTQKKRIHMRSASRVGHSDMGANLKRIQAFTKMLSQQIQISRRD